MFGQKYQNVLVVGFDPAAVSQAGTALQGVKKGIERAMAGAVNRTLAKSKTFTSKTIRQTFTINAAAVRRRLVVNRATKNKPLGSLKILGRPLADIQFKTKDTRTAPYDRQGTGVQVFYRKIGPPVIRPDAFIAVGSAGQLFLNSKQVFERSGKRRLPIRSQRSDPLRKLILESDVPRKLDGFIPPELQKQLRSQVDYILKAEFRKRK